MSQEIDPIIMERMKAIKIDKIPFSVMNRLLRILVLFLSRKNILFQA
jgi:hypothetical protein